jgi:hypothetical protein
MSLSAQAKARALGVEFSAVATVDAMIFRRPAPAEPDHPDKGNVVQRAQYKLQELVRRYNLPTFTLDAREQLMRVVLSIAGFICISIPPGGLLIAAFTLRSGSLFILAFLTFFLLALCVSHFCICFWGQVILKRDSRFAGVTPYAPLEERVKAFWERPELQGSTDDYYEIREGAFERSAFYFANRSAMAAKMPQIWKEMLAETDRYNALPEDEQVRALVLRTVFLEVSAKEKAS